MLVLTEDKETGTFQVGTTGKRICASIQDWAGDQRMGFTAWLLGTRDAAQGRGGVGTYIGIHRPADG